MKEIAFTRNEWKRRRTLNAGKREEEKHGSRDEMMKPKDRGQMENITEHLRKVHIQKHHFR